MKPGAPTFVPQVQPSSFSHTLISLKSKSNIIVVGAGIFGVSTAHALTRQGHEVTLIDAWGPGHSRSSSGDETRVIRSTYGANEIYFDLNVRSLSLWKALEESCGTQVFHNTGVLWLCHEASSPLVDPSIPFAEKHGMPYQYLSPSQLQEMYPIIQSHDLHHAYFDPYGGYLKARTACQLIHHEFQQKGGCYIQTLAKPEFNSKGEVASITTSDGSHLQADLFIFACGAWLGEIFPDVLGHLITCTKQEVYYFGVPPEQVRASEQLPVWVDVDGQDFYYGIPSQDYRGFKVGVDKRGVSFNPSHSDRTLDPSVLTGARSFLAHRFPFLKDAPLSENRVCPYENSPDGNFIIDMYPPSPHNTLIIGGGSGHGFKHGPALGEWVADALSQGKALPDIFSLKRFVR